MIVHKKKVIFTITTISILFASFYIVRIVNKTLTPATSCAFCNPSVIATHMFYEDQFVRGLCTHKPLEQGHCLIIPKRHIDRFDQASDDEILAMGRLIRKINTVIQRIQGPSSYLLLQKTGKEVGESIPHVHIHYIPKKISSSKLAVFGLLWGFILEPFRRPLSSKKLSDCVEHMKLEISIT